MTRDTINTSGFLIFMFGILLFSYGSHAKSDGFHISKVSATLFKGRYEEASKVLKFEAKYTSDVDELFSILLSFSDKQWTTNIVIDTSGAHQASVEADDIVINESDRYFLSQTAKHLSDYGEQENSDSLLLMMLAQMTNYWSKSPPNYVIKSGALGS